MLEPVGSPKASSVHQIPAICATQDRLPSEEAKAA